jgi:hypothetical protein
MAEDKGKQDEDDTGQDDEEEPEEEYEAPDKDTWGKTTEALSKANNEAKKWRLRAQGKDPKWAPAPPAKDDDTDDKPTGPKPKPVNVDQIRREAEEAALAKAKPGLVRSAAKDALKDAGLVVPTGAKAESALARAFRLIDLEEVDVDEDGAVSGLEDQVRAVKRDYPELFAKRSGRQVDAGAGSNGDPGKKADASANKLAALIRGG